MAAPSTHPVKVTTFLGHTPEDDDLELRSTSDITNQISAIYHDVIELAAAATNTQVDLSTKLDTCEYFQLTELSNPGLTFQFGPTTGAKYSVEGGKPALIGLDPAVTPPSIYLSNPSVSDKVFIEVIAMGTRS